MICVWWNFEGVLHFELVPNGRAMNAKLYCQQLDRVYDKLAEKYPRLVSRKRALFQQDNAKPHAAKKTKAKFEELSGVEVLSHPAYSPDHPIMVCFDQWNTSCAVGDLNLLKLKKRAKSFSIQSQPSGTSIRSGCLQIDGKKWSKMMACTLKNNCCCF